MRSHLSTLINVNVTCERNIRCTPAILTDASVAELAFGLHTSSMTANLTVGNVHAIDRLLGAQLTLPWILTDASA